MANIGDITGPLALLITLLWWFGITPQKVVRWTKEHKVADKIIFIITILFIAFGISNAALNFIADPSSLVTNRWIFGGFWISFSLIYATFVAERYVSRDGTEYKLLNFSRILAAFSAIVLLTIGLSIPAKAVLIVLSVSALVVLVGSILLLRRLLRKER